MSTMSLQSSAKSLSPDSRIWWTNGTFFIMVHVAAALGVVRYPWNATPRATLWLCFILWHGGMYGITIGYHRLYSHRAFRAPRGVRLFFALLGASACQGSIKWWTLRHRLHHRFTDDPKHDPYAATRGLLWAHMGWIFYKTHYERLALIDGDDLEKDPIVRFQHRFYVPLALTLGVLLPPAVGAIWGDPIRAFVWGSLVARILIWHCTFLINSLAHWDGIQPFTDENTSRTNFLLALFTCGEGNHNFHAFPHDYRSGPSWRDWDPSKWIIFLLHTLGWATHLRRARGKDMRSAQAHMRLQEQDGAPADADADAPWAGATWTLARAAAHARTGRCVVVVDGFAVDCTAYLGEHPGGAALLRKYAVRADAGTRADDAGLWARAEWAFHGGLNQHSRAARRRMLELRVARLALDDGDAAARRVVLKSQA